MLLKLGFFALFFSWLLPGHYLPWVTFEQQLLAAIAFLLIAIFVLASRWRHHSMPIPPLAQVAFALSTIPLIQWSVGQILYLQDAVLNAIYLLGFALCSISGTTLALFYKNKFLEVLEFSILFASLFSVGLALWQWQELGSAIWIADMVSGGRPFANLAQPNHLCTLLSLGLLASIGAFEFERIRASIAILIIFFLGFGIVMTQSRTGWLFITLLLVWFACTSNRCKLKTRRWIFGLSALAFVLLVVNWTLICEFLLVPSEASMMERAKAPGRLLALQILIDAAMRSPWVGYGWGQIPLAHSAAALDHPAGFGWLTNSHNIALDLLLWNGTPLGLGLIILLAWWFFKQIQFCCSALQWILLTSVATIFLHGLLEYPLDYTFFLFPVAFMMGALDAVRGKQLRAMPRNIFLVVLFLASALLFFITFEYFHVQSSSTQLRFVMAGIGVDKVSTAPVPEVYLLDALRDFHWYWTTPIHRGTSDAELEKSRKVIQRFPLPPAMLRHAFNTGLNKHPKEANITLKLLCKMHEEERCDEGRESWIQLQQQFPELLEIQFPAPTPERRKNLSGERTRPF